MSFIGKNPIVTSIKGDIRAVAAQTITNDTVLTSADRRYQVVIPSAMTNIEMPSTGVVAGEIWTFMVGAAQPTIWKAADASSLLYSALAANGSVSSAKMEKRGTVVIQAISNAPATNTDWRVLSVYESDLFTSTVSGDLNSSSGCRYTRVNNNVCFSGNFVDTSVAGLTEGDGIATLPHPVTFTTDFDLMGSAVITAAGTSTENALMKVFKVYAGSGGDADKMFVIYYNGNATAEGASLDLIAQYTLVGY